MGLLYPKDMIRVVSVFGLGNTIWNRKNTLQSGGVEFERCGYLTKLVKYNKTCY